MAGKGVYIGSGRSVRVVGRMNMSKEINFTKRCFLVSCALEKATVTLAPPSSWSLPSGTPIRCTKAMGLPDCGLKPLMLRAKIKLTSL